MDETVVERRERMRLFLARQKPMSRNAVCKRAGVSESAVGAFVRGGPDAPRFLTDDTYDRLYKWSCWTIAELKGDLPVPSEQDILSRKSANGKRTRNDSFTAMGQNAPRTDERPVSEGGMNKLDIVNRVLTLPDEYMADLGAYIHEIERTIASRSANPQLRGKTRS